jgi:hypothetical protein
VFWPCRAVLVSAEMENFDWKLTIRANILVLKVAGLWPKGSEIYKLNLYTLYSFVSLNLFINAHNFFQAANILFVYTDLEALTALIFVTITDVLASFKVYCFVRNIAILKRLMVKLDKQIFQPRNEKQRDLVRPNLNSWKYTYEAFYIPVVTTLVLWAIFPIIDGTVKDRRLPFSAWYPYNTKTSPSYEITYLYQVISIWFLAIANLNMDTLIAALMMYIGCQCDILCDDMKNLRNSVEDDFNRKLLDCIEHHKTILRSVQVLWARLFENICNAVAGSPQIVINF